MTESERSTTLSGLVSPEAEQLYARLRAVGVLRTGRADGEIDPHSSAVDELLSLGIAFLFGPDHRLIKPVELAVALRLLLEARQSELISTQSRILDGWTQLSRMLPAAAGAAPGQGSGVRVLTRPDDIVAKVTELYLVPRNRLRCLETGTFPNRSSGWTRQPRSPAAAGARVQVIYETGYHSTAAGSLLIEQSTRIGEQARLRTRVPARLLHADDATALVFADRSGQTALAIHAPGIVALLAEWFDLLWDHPATMPYPASGADSGLTKVQRDVLNLMMAGDDEVIARRLGLSVTTVRRHVKAIYQALGVNNRFAAGMIAAKLAWI